jgi:hypothetical protein
VFLFLGIVNYLRWSKEELQFFKVALKLSRDVRGEFWGGTVFRGGIVDGAAMAIGSTRDRG